MGSEATRQLRHRDVRVRSITKDELVEVSIVTIPANPNAVIELAGFDREAEIEAAWRDGRIRTGETLSWARSPDTHPLSLRSFLEAATKPLPSMLEDWRKALATPPRTSRKSWDAMTTKERVELHTRDVGAYYWRKAAGKGWLDELAGDVAEKLDGRAWPQLTSDERKILARDAPELTRALMEAAAC